MKVAALIQISPNQVRDTFRSLFDPQAPCAIRSRAVLAGGNAGIILCDNISLLSQLTEGKVLPPPPVHT